MDTLNMFYIIKIKFQRFRNAGLETKVVKDMISISKIFFFKYILSF